MKIYTILDTTTNEFWKHKAKQSWISKGAAKSAVMQQIRAQKLWEKHWKEVFKDNLILSKTESPFQKITFADQKRFKCLEFDLTKFNHENIRHLQEKQSIDTIKTAL